MQLFAALAVILLTGFGVSANPTPCFYPKLNTVACFPPKVGSTSWHTLFAQASEEPMDYDCDHPAEHRPALRPKVAFMVSRDPWERLVSAYYSKFAGDLRITYQCSWILRALDDMRNANGFEGFYADDDTTPYFSTFINYLLASDVADLNPHIQPICYNCKCSSFNYDKVIAIEDAETEFPKMAERVLMGTDKTYLRLEELNQHKSQHKEKKYMIDYYTDEMAAAIGEMFKEDVKLNGYSWEAHKEMALKERGSLERHPILRVEREPLPLRWIKWRNNW